MMFNIQVTQNLYEVNSGSSLAKNYDNISVLENHHIETALSLLTLPACNITDSMTDDTGNTSKII